eukprot:TRINITY_DN6046_c0_g1_i3.p1 TRINITY_DN6046_c0_g1~~TRINITY_DN6046_c0_g1_i3.p1  ORF type:complete len:115 (-),score=29.97 TRINITY_DN6046_c0_g1_i3:108-452(-)
MKVALEFRQSDIGGGTAYFLNCKFHGNEHVIDTSCIAVKLQDCEFYDNDKCFTIYIDHADHIRTTFRNNKYHSTIKTKEYPTEEDFLKVYPPLEKDLEVSHHLLAYQEYPKYGW